MGMSATQMRFLMVTARKSNVEYQGQQINQARTALANQSSELYTQLMTLKAPTAPSVYKYVVDPTVAPEIDWTDTNAFPAHTDMKTFYVHYAGNQPSFKDFNIAQFEEHDDGSGHKQYREYLGRDEKTNEKKYGEWQDSLPTDRPSCYVTTGIDKTGHDVTYTAINVPNTDDFSYFWNSETGLFELKEGVDEGVQLPQWLQAYNVAMSQYNKFSKPKAMAIYDPKFKDTKIDEDTPVTRYQYSATTDYDEAQYNAAYAQYEADLAEYERACDEINAKTEEIHEADKKLELQLKQLDTEQEAIQTEYDALKKVLDKNIENTFKTFG